MIFDYIEWDEANLDHATRRATDIDIEQAIWNASEFRRHRQHPGRVMFQAATNGGRMLTVVAAYDEARNVIRPITAWEEK